jgi:hypothetical protein
VGDQYVPAGYQKGDEDVAPRRPLTKKELQEYLPLMRDMIRSIPWRERFPGPQFSPRDVPIIEGSPAGQLMFDPMLGRDDVEPYMAQQGTDSVPAMLTPHEAVLNVGAADIFGRDKIRILNAMGQRRMYQQGTEDANMTNPLDWVAQYQYGTSDVSEDWTPEQLAIINRIRSNQTDYTFGPGSPNPTREDLGTYPGGPYSPASGFAVHGGVALAPQEYNLFTPEQRRKLGIMDIASKDQAGKIERYYESPVYRNISKITGLVEPEPYTGPYPSGSPAAYAATTPAGTAPTTAAAAETSKPEGFDVAGFGKSLGKLGASLADEGEALVKQGGATGWALLNSGWGNPYVNQDPLALVRAFMQFGGGG